MMEPRIKFLSLALRPRNAQAWRAHDDNGERIDVEDRQRTVKNEGEGFHWKRGEELRMKNATADRVRTRRSDKGGPVSA